jgi:hypothetical protein
MLADAQYFNSRISRLEGADDLGPFIVDIVKNKPLIVDQYESPSIPAEKKPPSPTKAVERTVHINGEEDKSSTP